MQAVTLKLGAVQGQGIHYDAAGNEYQGMWVKGVREGEGLQIYMKSEPDESTTDVYEGSWVQDNRLRVCFCITSQCL